MLLPVDQPRFSVSQDCAVAALHVLWHHPVIFGCSKNADGEWTTIRRQLRALNKSFAIEYRRWQARDLLREVGNRMIDKLFPFYKYRFSVDEVIRQAREVIRQARDRGTRLSFDDLVNTWHAPD